jgi:thiamine phosphate synthase YjbQ (UPF0047 family)
VFRKKFSLKSNKKIEFIKITDLIQSFIDESGASCGKCDIVLLHTTCAVIFNEFQEALSKDFEFIFKRTDKLAEDVSHVHVLSDGERKRVFGFRHDCEICSDCFRQNASAHLFSALLGNGISFQIYDGKIVRGKYQDIIFAEFDGPQERFFSLMIY